MKSKSHVGASKGHENLFEAAPRGLDDGILPLGRVPGRLRRRRGSSYPVGWHLSSYPPLLFPAGTYSPPLRNSDSLDLLTPRPPPTLPYFPSPLLPPPSWQLAEQILFKFPKLLLQRK